MSKSKLVGTWKLVSSDANWDEYMKTVGVGFATRQIGKRVSSTEDIGDHGEEWSLKITSTFKNIALRFKLGDEFEETTMDGRKVMSVFNLEDGKLVHYQKAIDVGIPDSVIVRELVDDNTMTVTFEAIGKGVKSTRTFKRFFAVTQ